MRTRIFFCFFLVFASLFGQAQSKEEKSDVKFGKIGPGDFDLSKYSFDTSAAAIVIADIGSSRFEGNNKGWFSLIFTRHKRIKVLNKNGVSAADISIPVYYNGTSEEKIERLKASAFNIENGQVIETKLDESSIFKDNISKHLVLKKFSLPAVKVGSILDITYTIKSDFLFNLQPWEFQGEYPELWSEYSVETPDFFNYVMLSHGSQEYYIKNSKSDIALFSVLEPGVTAYERSQTYNFRATSTVKRWVMKNVPALKEEPYTTSTENYLSRIEFQLSQYRFPDMPVKDIMGNWYKMAARLNEDEDFGSHLHKANNWLSDDIKAIAPAGLDTLSKARKIFAYVRDNFTCTRHSGKYLTAPIKTVLKNKNGNVADVNLLLTAILNHQGIKATPVILSTRGNGFTNEFYPLINQYNYVICQAEIGDKKYYLDASVQRLGFNRLPEECYNGHARCINADAALAVYFDADSLQENKVTTMQLFNDEKGKWTGYFTSALGYYESLNVRDRIKEKGKETFLNSIKQGLPSEWEVSNLETDSLNIYDEPVTVKYDIDAEALKQNDIIYFSPMVNEGYKENPFKAAERLYPVEMPCTTEELYLANIEIPEGYEVDEIPKSARVNLNETDGSFEYLIAEQDGKVMLRSKIKFSKANFTAEDYQTLRDFFTFVVNKQSEQVVFKKKK